MFNYKRKIALVLAMVTMACTNNCYIAKAENISTGYERYLNMIENDSEKIEDMEKVELTENWEYAEVNQVIDEKMTERVKKSCI